MKSTCDAMTQIKLIMMHPILQNEAEFNKIMIMQCNILQVKTKILKMPEQDKSHCIFYLPP